MVACRTQLKAKVCTQQLISALRGKEHTENILNYIYKLCVVQLSFTKVVPCFPYFQKFKTDICQTVFFLTHP